MVLLAAIAAGGCGGGDGGGDGGSDGGGDGGAASIRAVDDFIAAMAAAQCDWAFRCCTDADLQVAGAPRFTTATECRPYVELELKNGLYISRLGVREGRIGLDEMVVKQCLDGLRMRSCNPLPTGIVPRQMMDPMALDACAGVFKGRTAPGNECLLENECREGSRCVRSSARGVCVPFQAAGEVCNRSEDCDPRVKNIYCALKDFHCRVRAKVGEACAYTTDSDGRNPRPPLLIECNVRDDHSYCDPVSKTCKRFPGDGDACLPSMPLVPQRCDPDPALRLICDGPAPASAGGTCRSLGGIGSDCNRAPCNPTLACSMFTRTCQALPGVGQSCVEFSGRCAPSLFCRPGTLLCESAGAAGETCQNRPCAAGLVCDPAASTCVPGLASGQPCTAGSQCVSGLCGSPTGMSPTCQAGATPMVQCSGRTAADVPPASFPPPVPTTPPPPLLPPGIRIDPTSGAFGSVSVGRMSLMPLELTVFNAAGNATSGPISVSVSPPGEYTATGCNGATLTGGASCRIQVSFAPSMSGSRTASLAVTATPGGSVYASLLGTGVTESAPRILPDNANFGDAAVGTMMGPTRMFSVTNVGTASTMLVLSVNGPDFILTPGGCALPVAGGASCTATVTFRPTTRGAKQATLIASGPGGVATAALTGNGLAPARLVAAPAMAAIAGAVGVVSPPITIGVANTGDERTGTISATLGGANAAEFMIASNTCAAPLSGGANCMIAVAMRAGAAGARVATLTLAGMPGGVATVMIAGTAM